MNAREHYAYVYRLLRTANTATNHALSPEASESFRNRHTFSTLGAEYRNLVHAARYPRFNPDNRAEIKIRFEYLFWQRHARRIGADNIHFSIRVFVPGEWYVARMETETELFTASGSTPKEAYQTLQHDLRETAKNRRMYDLLNFSAFLR